MYPIIGCVSIVTYSDLPNFRDGVVLQLVYDRQHHLVTGDLAKVDPVNTHPIINHDGDT